MPDNDQPKPPSFTEAQHRLEVLRARFDVLRRRLGRTDGLADLQRLDRSLRRRRVQLAHLDAQTRRIEEERARVIGELTGVLTGTEALLTELVENLEALDGETWSPTPIVGFTLLTAADDRLHDGDIAWHQATMSGICHRSLDAPHHNPVCDSSPCGVTAWKTPASFSQPAGETLIVAAQLALSGRVIEHERGYRAAVATITRLVASDGKRWVRTADAEQISSLTARPASTFTSLSAPMPADSMLFIEIDLYLGTDVAA